MFYFDNAATTPVVDEIQEIVRKYNVSCFYNPSSLHRYALSVSKDISQAHEYLCKALRGSGNIIFTSCGTEADNLAINSCLRAKKGNIVVTAGEHSAVFNAVQALADKYEIRIAPLNGDGSVKGNELCKLIDNDTLAACIMHVNNETGAVNNISQLSKEIKSINSHCAIVCDGIQAIGKIEVNLDALGVDYYTASGHKIHAPKGIGFVYARKGATIRPQILGGGQEGAMRSGTENVAGIMSFSYAVERVLSVQKQKTVEFEQFKQCIISKLQPNWYKLICPSNASPSILTLAFDRLESQILLNMLEQKEIIIGLGSACNSKKTSRVTKAIGLEANYINGVVRISFSRLNTLAEVEVLSTCLAQSVANLRTIKGIK